jgi:parallel beta-helix repeat protein
MKKSDSAKISIRKIILQFSVLLFAYVLSGNALAVITHSGTISAHTTWSTDDVHLITGDVTVSAGIVLTIDPGTIVKFNSNRSLTINGALNAAGTTGNRIIFTSYRDDANGGDSNSNGPSSAAPGDWGRIYFSQTVTEGLTSISNIDVLYAGSSGDSIYIYQNNIGIASSTIRYSSTRGLYIYNASPTIDGNTISDNAQEGIYSYYGSPLIQNNTLSNNDDGIYARYSTPTINGNTITDNRSMATPSPTIPIGVFITTMPALYRSFRTIPSRATVMV